MPEVLDVARSVPLRNEEAEVDVAPHLNGRLGVAHQRLRLRQPLLERGVVEHDPDGLVVVFAVGGLFGAYTRRNSGRGGQQGGHRRTFFEIFGIRARDGPAPKT